jgi:iron(II)-dependent oxidoreductase
MLRIGFVLLTFRVDAPAGIERSVAALAEGLQLRGHACWFIAAGPKYHGDDKSVIRLRSVELPVPATPSFILKRINAVKALAELESIAALLQLDIICFVDAIWGLGFVGKMQRRQRLVLMIHFLDENNLEHVEAALNQNPDAVVVPSDVVLEVANRFSLNTSSWAVIPNALLSGGAVAPSQSNRETLREKSPIHIIGRADPIKGIAALLECMPADPPRPVECVLSKAPFEYKSGDQQTAEIKIRTSQASTLLHFHDPLEWRGVQPFLAEASLCIIPSLHETFGLVALESMSVGTPVVSFAVGNLPNLIQGAGSCVPFCRGPLGLWQAAREILNDRSAYLAASTSGIKRAAEFNCGHIADMFVSAVMQ